MSKIGLLSTVFFSILGGIAVLRGGYVHSYLDEETQTRFFLKKRATLQVEFFDPFANEGELAHVNQLSHNQRKMFADYCQYRFGITDHSTEALEKCKSQRPSYLAPNFFKWP